MPGDRAPRLIALDTNFLVASRVARSEEAERLEAILRSGATVQIGAVAWSEYLCGPIEPDDVAIARRLVREIVPFTESDADLASALFNDTGRRSRSHADCMIAAQAILRGAALATSNIGDFRHFEKFRLRIAFLADAI